MCLPCDREYHNQWNRDNPDKAAKYARKNLLNNYKNIRESQRRYKRANHEKVALYASEYGRRYYKNNLAYFKRERQKWKAANPEKVRASNRNRRALKRNAEGTHTIEDIKILFARQKGMCLCGEHFANFIAPKCKKGYHVDHIIPLTKGGSNLPNNLQLLCPPCNMQKNAKDPNVWREALSNMDMIKKQGGKHGRGK